MYMLFKQQTRLVSPEMGSQGLWAEWAVGCAQPGQQTLGVGTAWSMLARRGMGVKWWARWQSAMEARKAAAVNGIRDAFPWGQSRPRQRVRHGFACRLERVQRVQRVQWVQ